jgi:hypothetical protein
MAYELMDDNIEPEGGEEADFFPAEGTPQLPESYITLRTAGGDTRYVETAEALPVISLLEKSDLRINGDVQAWFEGAQVNLSTTIPVGGTVILIGSVKGGSR